MNMINCQFNLNERSTCPPTVPDQATVLNDMNQGSGCEDLVHPAYQHEWL